MFDANLEAIKEKIAAQHNNDERQLEIIFSDDQRLVVEAPAGYGKTTTMISRIAYLFASGKIPNPKRILGLTFSVNAALKVKREVAGKLPLLLGSQNSPVAIDEKIAVTNYHGFCKGILKKYGYLVADVLRKDINTFYTIGENDIEKQNNLKTALTSDELESLIKVEASIKKADMPDSPTIQGYNDIIIKKLLPLEYVTYNAIILFVLQIFENCPEVKKFYQSFYPLIVVDEFQDTNCIAWALLQEIISDQTQLLFLGDPLQRIYGFIGAIPNIMSIATQKYGMTGVALSKNYRFRNNIEMLKLDKNIRANALYCFDPVISEEDIAKLPALWGDTQEEEANQIAEKVQALMNNGAAKIAILFRGRGNNLQAVETALSNKNISYFYGIFTDEDTDYVEFHSECQEMFVKQFGNKKTINKKALISFCDNIKKQYAKRQEKSIHSLLQLLDALVEKVYIDYGDLLPEDMYTLLLDIFENRQLKQAMEYIDSQVILSTIHGAKGLEWDYVILDDVARKIFPNYFTCEHCINYNYKIQPNYRFCVLPKPLPKDFKDTALDELSVFYVGITRAKKQVYVSASATRLNSLGEKKSSFFSCMVGIVGVKLVQAK